MLKNPRFTALGLLMLTMAIGAGTLVFRVLTLHPRTNSVDLDSLQKRLRAAEIPSLHSVLVIQYDQMIVEWYFEGADEDRGRGWLGTVKFGPETLHDVRSITKSIVSLLFGIAMAEGAIRSLDSPVLDYFPEYKDLQTPERRKIRLRDLLTMTSGLRWDEWSYPYGDIHNGETAMDAARDRYEYILSLPIDSPPCREWRYSGGDAALIAAVVARSTKIPIDVYAGKKLFGPLGIREFVWVKDNNGIPIAASGLRMLPRDMAKIGLLLLHEGRDARGHQIVPKSWIRESTAPHVTAVEDVSCKIRYGYFWWVGPGCKGSSYCALGNGGQSIWVAPSRDIVIVTTAGLYNSPVQKRVMDVWSAVVDASR